MAFSYRELFFGGTKFCRCIPVRTGVIIMTILGILLSGILSVVLWYQVSVGGMASSTNAAFVAGGLVETLLFAASIFGLVGAITRKQSFVQIYATVIYVHFLLNLGVAIWLFFELPQAASKVENTLCKDTIKDSGAQDQCTNVISLGQEVYIVVAALVLFCEMYGAIIVTRYVNQLKRGKSYARQSRAGVEEAFMLHAAKTRDMSIPMSSEWVQMGTPRPYNDDDEFDPYQEAEVEPPQVPSKSPQRYQTFIEGGRPSPPIEVGYGGGTWTHEEISEEEKARLQRQDRELGVDVVSSAMDETEAAKRRLDIKSVGGPATLDVPDVEELPRYTYSGSST